MDRPAHEATTSPTAPTPASWAYLCGGIATEVTGSLSLRGALDRHWLYAVVVLGFLGATICLSRSLRHGMNVGVAYGIWGACGVALTGVFSSVLFSEALTPLAIAGIVVVIAGVLCIELGSQAAAREGRARAVDADHAIAVERRRRP